MIARHLTDGVKQALYTKVIFHIHVTISERMINLKLKQSKEKHKGIQKLRLNDLLIQYSAQNIVHLHLHFSVPGVCRAIIIPIQVEQETTGQYQICPHRFTVLF